MARIYGLVKKLERHHINEQLAKEIIGNGDLVGVTERMEKLLDPEMAYQILDSSACGTSKKELNALKIIDGQTLEEKIAKIAFLDDFHSDWNVALNPDNTLTAGWTVKDDKYNSCVCSAPVNKNMKVSDLAHGDRAMPLTYCRCCAGHCRRHLERLLGISLKTIKVVSSPINSKGEEPCEFMFEII